MLTLVGCGAVVFLMTFVIPRFADIFRDLDQAIPLPTQILLAASEGIQHYWWAFLLAGPGGRGGARVMLSGQEGRLAWGRFFLRLSLAGEVALKSEVARLTRVLGSRLRSGVPLLTALTVGREMMANAVLAGAVDRLSDGVRRGAWPRRCGSPACFPLWPSTWCGSARRRAGSRRCS